MSDFYYINGPFLENFEEMGRKFQNFTIEMGHIFLQFAYY